jgi:hypothetical protein
MKILWKFLGYVCDYNSFAELDQLTLIKGNAETVYFRLVQEEPGDQEDRLQNLRYIPAVGATLEVTFRHIDTDQVITRFATMVYPSDDRSVWKIDILETDRIAFGTMEAKLTEGIKVRSLSAGSRLVSEEPGSGGKAYC